ncbi:MAG: nuclear transport factor 2 family protein, partial [Egibacteraceae bacterium]
MSITPIEDGLRVVDASDDIVIDEDRRTDEDQPASDVDLESLRDEFVDAFNARDLDAVLGIVDENVETPDTTCDGAANLAEELQAIWERSPGAILTRAFLDGNACAVAWLPDEDGCWSRAALVCFDFDVEVGLLTVVAVPDDADALDRAEADDPTGSEPDEWHDWVNWEHGEETIPL